MILKNKWLIIMIWLTVLVVFGVFKIDTAIQSAASGSQTVNFGTSPIPVQVTHPGTDNISVVPMGNDTIWIIDRASMTVSVLTRDKSGQFHLRTTMSYNQK